MPLTRDSFLTVAFPASVEVQVPALSGSVLVACLTCGERDQLELEQTEAKGADFRARVVVYSARDEHGRPLFTKADIAALSKLPGYVLDPIVRASVKLNKFTASDIEDLEKNSESVPSAG